jgi:arginine/ornithine transport system substrate-binding protein
MMSFTRRLALGAAAALFVLASAAYAKDWTKVRIGTEGAYPPFNYMSPDGQIVGFDVDIAMALCEHMKVECTLVQQDWDGIIPALLAKKYDAVVASMSITDERKQKVDFTKKYYQTPARFVARKGSGIEISKEGLTGKKVGVQRATTNDSFLTDNFGDAQREPAQDRPGQGLRVRRTRLFGSEMVRLRHRYRLAQVRHGSARQAQRGDRRDPCRRHLGQDRREILRLRRVRQLTWRERLSATRGRSSN